MIRQPREVLHKAIENCHGGRGTLDGRIVITREDGFDVVPFMHDDVLPPGATIGEHHHEHYEIYYVLAGQGTLIYDGRRVQVAAGAVNVVEPGHSHGIENTGDLPMRLLVVGLP